MADVSKSDIVAASASVPVEPRPAEPQIRSKTSSIAKFVAHKQVSSSLTADPGSSLPSPQPATVQAPASIATSVSASPATQKKSQAPAWKVLIAERKAAKQAAHTKSEQEDTERWAVHPPWKRPLLQKKAEVRRKKELDDEAAQKRLLAIPKWRLEAQAQAQTRDKRAPAPLQPERFVTSSVRSPTPVRKPRINDEDHSKRIEGVMKARLYLLSRKGPNAFVVGSDNLQKKYVVIIGAQTCSCSKASCVHVLFVMLRVLKVQPNDPRIFSKSLQNYEIETLIREFDEARKTTSRKQPKPMMSDCPICLLPMTEGESIVACNHCKNVLHHHCLTIWADHRKQQNEPVQCPLCRQTWASAEAGNAKSAHLMEFSLDVQPDDPLPYEPVSPSMAAEYRPWVAAFGSELVSCLLSSVWKSREIALKKLYSLLRSRFDTLANDVTTLQVIASVIENACEDSVRRVYIAALSIVPLLMLTGSVHLKMVMTNIVNVILTKCGDADDRKAERSIHVIIDIAKGIPEGMAFTLKCVTQEHTIPKQDEWRWWHGRLMMLQTLLVDFKHEFNPRASHLVASCEQTPATPATALRQLTQVKDFAESAHRFKHRSVHDAAERVLEQCDEMEAIITEDVIPQPFEMPGREQQEQFRLDKTLDDSSVLRNMRTIFDSEQSALDDTDSDDDIDGDCASTTESSHCPPSTVENVDDQASPVPFEPKRRLLTVRIDESVTDISIKSHEPPVTASVAPVTKSTMVPDPAMDASACAASVETAWTPRENAGDQCEHLLITSRVPDLEDAGSLLMVRSADVVGTTTSPNSLSDQASQRGSSVSRQSTDDTVVPDRLDPSLPHVHEHYLELDSWRKGPLLGTGAFSSCYSAMDNSTGTLMAVKQVSFCNNTVSDENRMLTNITREIEVLRSLGNHPNVIQYFGAVREENHFNIFMEYMAGGCIASALKKFGAYPEDVLRRYTADIVKGLCHLHSHGIMHRDLKGANIVIDQTGRAVKLCDFGAASRLSALATMTGEFRSTHGTPAFMAPEVIRGEPYGRSSDIWSLGCCVIEMATGSHPWHDEQFSNQFALMFKIASGDHLPPIPKHLSEAAVSFILACLKRDPTLRPKIHELAAHEFVASLIKL